jgi:predicted nucleotidyltransferase
MVYSVEELKARIVPVLQKRGVKSAVLFGSYATGFADEKSDVDLLVDSGLRGFSFFGLIEYIREALEDKDVDVFDVSEVVQNSRMENEIKKTGVRIYG